MRDAADGRAGRVGAVPDGQHCNQARAAGRRQLWARQRSAAGWAAGAQAERNRWAASTALAEAEPTTALHSQHSRCPFVPLPLCANGRAKNGEIHKFQLSPEGRRLHIKEYVAPNRAGNPFAITLDDAVCATRCASCCCATCWPFCVCDVRRALGPRGGRDRGGSLPPVVQR